ncbi:uncharacterized protein IWZ02DRAFT_441227 [Phyllosticta citriasiana]|uniref:uncharacterized protein n=1 Tax=Phyllosticta citriasiana TaxID=595635 RepID=UPI0030FDD622
MLPDPATLDAVVGSQNLQGFNEALGGIAAGPITESDDLQRRYKANGNTFPTFIEAAQRTCEVQANDCTTAANTPQQNNNNNDNQKPDPNPSNNGTPSQQAQKIELTIDKCEAQRTRCLSFQSKSASVTTFPDQSSTSTTTSSTTAPPTVNATTTTTTTTAAASTSTLSLVTTTNTTTTTAPPPLPPGAGPTGTQLINLGPDPQFPMFDLLCDV